MISNGDIAKFYLQHQSEDELLRFLCRKGKEREENIKPTVKAWISSFKYYWSKHGCKKRFFEKESKWIKSVFTLKQSGSPASPFNNSGTTSPSCISDSRSSTSDYNSSSAVSESTLYRKVGRKRLQFNDLTEQSKAKSCQRLARDHPLDKLLRAAEAAARKLESPAVTKILKLLRNGGESWAKNTLNTSEVKIEPSPESSLMLKTRLGLSKSKYQGIIKFMKHEFGMKHLISWADMISYRNSIIPPFSSPNWADGYLSTSVSVRDLIKNDVERVLELDDVRSKIFELCADYRNVPIHCVVRIAGGPDSATGFSHYNQSNILGNDDSLLSENYMLLQLLKKTGEPIYQNPNPQSDYFCRPRSLCWTKETDVITRKMFDAFFYEIDQIKDDPVVVTVKNIELHITAQAIYSMIDGKVANAIVGNKNTHACPVCLDTTSGKIGPSFFHARLNSVEWAIRSAAKKSVPGHPALTHPQVKLEARRIADCLEQHFKVQVNRPKPGGSGSSNNGNLARRLLSEPDIFADILNVSRNMMQNLRLISNLALSSRKLNAEKVKLLYERLEKSILEEFPFIKALPPSLHKYKHLADYIDQLPYTMNFVDEQAGERMHKRHKFCRPNLARKMSPEANLSDMMATALAWSDPKLSYLTYHNEGSNVAFGSKDVKYMEEVAQYYMDSGVEDEGEMNGEQDCGDMEYDSASLCDSDIYSDEEDKE